MARVGENEFTGRTGVIKVAAIVNQARCLWRETPLHDVGIDGQIEHVTSHGEATGRFVALQIKSGASFFRTSGEQDRVTFSVPDRHASYWSSFPFPVILVLHDEARDLTVWADARAALRRGENPITVHASNSFDVDAVRQVLALEGPLPQPVPVPRAVLTEMARSRFEDAGLAMSFLDLFSHGLTDLAHSLYFNMDLFTEVGEVNAFLAGREEGIGVGADAYEFIDRYVAFLVVRDIARVDFDAWREADLERQMVRSFIAPLTVNGRRLVELISCCNRELPEQDRGPVIEERLVRVLPLRIEERARALGAIAEKLGSKSD